MKIDIVKNRKVLIKFSKKKFELHPLWLRERASSINLIDPLTKQRIYHHSALEKSIKIKKANFKKNLLNVEFSDGINSKFKLDELYKELNTNEMKKGIEKKLLWNSTLKKRPAFKFNKDFESKEVFKMLKEFHKFGFVIINKVPTKNNYIVKFANSIGAIRPTNFGVYFDVKSIPNYNDLAYTPRHLYPHTDNPYRKPVPCIQLLHCIKNEVSGGYSTLVDGFALAEYLKKKYKNYFDILTSTKVRFRFVDKNVILENWGELIELDDNKKVKQIRFNTKVEYVPHLNKKNLDLFYKARKKMGELCSSKNFEIKFKLMPGDLLMMDNYRTLHGRTSYDATEGMRHLKGCYIDYDSSEGKLMHLKRKFK